MKRIKVFLGNALILAAVTLFMRTVSVVWGAYVSRIIGAEGMGLFSLITSAYGFAVVLATSGINLATVRLVSEEIAFGRGRGATGAVVRCLAYALVFGGASFFLLFFGADFIGNNILGDARTVISLRTLSISLPFIAVTNVFAGYFSAVRRIYKSAAANIVEQFIKIGIILSTIGMLAPRGIEYACLALVIGTSVSEGLSFSYMFVMYLIDRRRLPRSDATVPHDLVRRMIGISLPVAAGAYLRSGLVTLEHVLIPRGLHAYGENAAEALSLYGVVHGMVFPLVLFPAALCQTFASLIVPELSEMSATYGTKKDNRHINYVVSRSIKFGLMFALITAAVFITFADGLGELVYHNALCAKYIRIFGVLVPVMYLDTVVDGMLKGLGEQMASMRYNIIDAAASVALVLLLTPRLGVDGYVLCVFITEILNASLSMHRLIKVTGVRLKIIEYVAVPALAAAGAAAASNLVFRPIGMPTATFVIIGITVCAAVYLALSRLLGAISRDDVRWAKNAMK